MFKVYQHHSTAFSKVILEDDSINTAVEIIPGCGGIVNDFVVQTGVESLSIIEGYEDEIDFRDNLMSKGFRSVKLFPFVGRLINGEYENNGQQHRMNSFYMNGHAIHGIIADKPFDVEEIYAGQAWAGVTLKYAYRGDDPGYPFKFDCVVTYELHARSRLLVRTKIINNEGTALPITDGWHPYFKLKGAVDEWNLQIPADKKVLLGKTLTPTGEMVEDNKFNDGASLAGEVLDDCFLLLPGRKVNLTDGDGNMISIAPGQDYPYLQVYTPEDRKSIAIENVSGVANSFNNKLGLIRIPMGAEKEFVTSYQFHPKP